MLDTLNRILRDGRCLGGRVKHLVKVDQLTVHGLMES